MTAETILNGMLADLGQEQDAEEWSYDRITGQAWFTANHPDGRMIEVWMEHVSADGCGYTAITFTKP